MLQWASAEGTFGHPTARCALQLLPNLRIRVLHSSQLLADVLANKEYRPRLTMCYSGQVSRTDMEAWCNERRIAYFEMLDADDLMAVDAATQWLAAQGIQNICAADV